MYNSNDIIVGGRSFLRIPATFVQSHVYAATMNMSIPFLAHGLESGKRVRLLCIAGIGAAIIGVFMSGARTPVVFLVLSVLYVLTTVRVRAQTWAALVVVSGVMAFLVLNNQRLQRFQSLGDTDYVSDRIYSSVNASFLDALTEHPLGKGLAAGYGTNIPGFLSLDAKPQIGLESEYARIVIDTGIPGLMMWLAFFFMALRRKVGNHMTAAMRTYSAPVVLTTILGGALGAGMFTAIPSAAMFLLLVGVRTSVTEAPPVGVAWPGMRGRRNATLRNVARPALAAANGSRAEH
jgi:hypothetical protein